VILLALLIVMLEMILLKLILVHLVPVPFRTLFPVVLIDVKVEVAQHPAPMAIRIAIPMEIMNVLVLNVY
jgi:hypothetical protein